MRGRGIIGTLLALMMVLTLLPVTAFAREIAEETPACVCETPCTAENMNVDCPVCGAEGALPENCAKYIDPANDALTQPEGEPAVLNDEGGNAPLNGTASEVSSAADLVSAMADPTVSTVKLTADIDISDTLTVTRTVTLDLNGKVLRIVVEPDTDSRVFDVRSGGSLTLTDSDTTVKHKFTPNTNGLWVLDEENGKKTVTGGVITGGSTGQGGGVYVFEGGTLTMDGGNIVGCRVNGQGGGVYVFGGTFTMNGGTIAGCAADKQGAQGGGVYVHNGCDADAETGRTALTPGVFTMNNGSIIDCVASTYMGGSVYIKNSVCGSEYHGRFTMNGGSISDCGVADLEDCNTIYNIGTFIANGGTVTSSSSGKFNYALYNLGIFQTEQGKSGTEFFGAAFAAYNSEGFDGGIFNGEVLNCERISGGTFRGTVTNRNGGVIAGGIFESSSTVINEGGTITGGTFESASTVINKGGRYSGTITGGKFNGTVDNNGAITGGTFNGTVTGTPAFATGSGTETDPYLIYSAEGLKAFRDIVNSTNSAACAVLMNDIVLNDGTFDENGNYSSGPSGTPLEEWTPIGEYKTDGDNTPYTGTFDGQGHAIKGLYVNLESDVFVGLFGCLKGAAVRNLTVDGYVQGCSYVGGITGKAKANGSTPSTIENCRNNCRVAGKANISSSLNAGGIVGSAEDTTIAGCVNTGVVELSGSNSFSSVAGGIANSLYENVTVKNCYNTGEIKVTGDSLKKSVAGGIAGYNLYAGSTVSDCYNVGAVTVSFTGSRGDYTAAVGGIMGDIYKSTVSNCYSVGTLTSMTGTGTSDIGGVVGRNRDGTVENCYCLDSTAKKAIGNNDGTADEATGPKTAAEFGNGTVLAELINGRSNDEHPWDTTCQYLAAAGRTLPVFKGQGDTHTHQSDKWEANETEHWKVCACGAVFDKAAHSGTDDGDCTTAVTCACGHTITAAKDHTWGAWTSNDDGTHTRRCTVDGCTKGIETANCSGGKATCSAKAQCEVCGAAYGALDPNAHGSGLKHTPAKAATTSHQGNIEYWYCANCGKFFSDAAATKVIAPADTVIEKLRHSGVTRRYPAGAATGQPDASGTGKTIKSQDTGDAGVALYAATALLSLTGAAWLTGKKRR